MTFANVNLGARAADGTGDPLRTAFDKINRNFNEVLTLVGNTSSSNVTLTNITMSSSPAGAAANIKYGLGNITVYNDGGWTIGEWNGTSYGQEGIRINPGIEGNTDINLPADAANVALSIGNFVGNIELRTGNGNTWKFDRDGKTLFPNYTFPAADGALDQTLVTDGAGNVSWATISGGTSYSNSNVAAYMPSYLPTYTGNIGAAVVTVGTIVFTDSSQLESAARLARFDVDGGLTVAQNLDVQLDGNFVGNVLIGGNLDIIGTVNFTGNINQVTGNQGQFTGDPLTGVGALYAGKSGYTPLPATVFQTSAYTNGYIQNNFQNLNPGNQSSTEWVATADNGDDSTNYLDMGIAGGLWDGSQSNSVGTAAKANDSWIYTIGNTSAGQGGNLIVGTIHDGRAIKILTGSSGASAVKSQFTSDGLITTANVQAVYLLGNGSKLTGMYSNSNVASYLVSNPQTGTYSNSNVASYLIDNPQTGTYSNSNVASYLVSNPQTGTYSNSNVASYLVSNPQSGTYGDSNVAAYLATSTGNVSFGNLTLSSNSSTLTLKNGATIYGDAGALNRNGSIVLQPYTGAGSTFPSVLIGGAGRLAAPNGSVHQIFNATDVTFQVAVKNITGTAATSTTTGALQITGGAGISGNIYAGGFVVKSSNPAFRVYGSGTSGNVKQTTSNVNLKGGTITVDYNQGSYFDSTTGKFTAPVAGLYQTTLVARVADNNGLNQIAVLKNGSNSGGNVVCFWETDTNAGTSTHFGTSGVAKMAVGDFLSANILAGNVNFDGNDSWTVTFLG